MNTTNCQNVVVVPSTNNLTDHLGDRFMTVGILLSVFFGCFFLAVLLLRSVDKKFDKKVVAKR